MDFLDHVGFFFHTLCLLMIHGAPFFLLFLSISSPLRNQRGFCRPADETNQDALGIIKCAGLGVLPWPAFIFIGYSCYHHLRVPVMSCGSCRSITGLKKLLWPFRLFSKCGFSSLRYLYLAWPLLMSDESQSPYCSAFSVIVTEGCPQHKRISSGKALSDSYLVTENAFLLWNVHFD